ncbi:MAG TPA: alpha/beta hydrolase-fold protein [Patescibacteria group bacterium]|nr:alpha/beta hydrolase-fold protein [Patescibacteria group bacterium]
MNNALRRYPGFRTFLTLFFLFIVSGITQGATRFCLTYSEDLQAVPISGRALLMLSVDPAVDPDVPDPFHTFITFGMDFAGWKPGETLVMTGQNSDSFKATIDQLKGSYSLRAVIDADLQSSILQKQGMLYSDKIIFEVNENGENIIDVRINNIVNGREFKETETVKLLKLRSDLLSAFHQTPTFIEAAVILPDTYAQNPGKHYPVVFVFPGWGSTHMAVTQGDFQQKRYGMLGYGEEKIFVFLNQDCRFGFHVFADSENNGPRATSFVTEFIPFLEGKYRVARQASGRFLIGQSSGGWAALWLQINFPDVFGMAWAGSPDPVDFRDFVGHDLYGKKANFFYDAHGGLIKALRSKEHPFTNKEWLEMETVLGDGGQFQSFEAVFGARGRDGKPQQLFDRKTGEIDPIALEHWKKYDINLILQKNAETLREKLAGRIHIVVAANDPFFLDGSVRRFKESLARLRFHADIEILESGEHNTWSEAIRKKMHEKMDELYLPEAGEKEKL